jgi:hypothetical protein
VHGDLARRLLPGDRLLCRQGRPQRGCLLLSHCIPMSLRSAMTIRQWSMTSASDFTSDA